MRPSATLPRAWQTRPTEEAGRAELVSSFAPPNSDLDKDRLVTPLHAATPLSNDQAEARDAVAGDQQQQPGNSVLRPPTGGRERGRRRWCRAGGRGSGRAGRGAGARAG